MKLRSRYENTFGKMGEHLATLIRIALYVLLVVIYCAIVFGIMKSGYDLVTGLGKSIEELLPRLLIDTVFIIALVEISMLLLSYLREGYVHVRYIVDTVLIIMLNEFVVLWFNGQDLIKTLSLIAVVLTLCGIRVAATKYSPGNELGKN